MLLATHLTHTQQAGFLALAVLMALGFIGLLFVRGGGRAILPAAGPRPEEIEAATSTWTSPAPSTRP